MQAQNIHMNRYSAYVTLGICEFEEKCDTTMNLWEGQKSETPTSNAGEDVKPQKLSLILVRMQNGTTVWKKIW